MVEAQSGLACARRARRRRGLVREHAGTAQIVLRRDGQTVQLGTFTSVADAVATARSPREVEPRA